MPRFVAVETLYTFVGLSVVAGNQATVLQKIKAGHFFVGLTFLTRVALAGGWPIVHQHVVCIGEVLRVLVQPSGVVVF
jgi:hypothetical protein